MLKKLLTIRGIVRTLVFVSLTCWLAGILPLLAQEKDSIATSGYWTIPDSLRGIYLTIDTVKYDKWCCRTVTFPRCTDTMRIIIDKDTIYTDENYFRVLVRYEVRKMRGKMSR
jgi:hypothetical protein